MKKICYFLFNILLCANTLSAEEFYLPELESLFGSDLVLDASYMRLDGPDYFFIQINEVLKGERYGLKKGDYIRLKQLKTDGCGFPYMHSARRRNRYYLIKTNVGWSINHSSPQSIADLTHFDGIVKLNSEGEPITLNSEIKEFLECYAYNKESRKYDAIVSKSELMNLAQYNILVSTFEKQKRLSLSASTEEEFPNTTPLTRPEETPIVFCDFMAKPAVWGLSQEDQRNYLIEDENPMIKEGFEGKVILECVIDTSGHSKDIVILRGLHPNLDSLAIEKIRNMPKWTPAQDGRGNKKACSYRFPVTFKISEIQE